MTWEQVMEENKMEKGDEVCMCSYSYTGNGLRIPSFAVSLYKSESLNPFHVI